MRPQKEIIIIFCCFVIVGSSALWGIGLVTLNGPLSDSKAIVF